MESQNAEEPTTSPITETPKEEEKLKSTIVEEKTAEAEEQAKPAAAPKVEEPVKTTEEPKSEEAKPAPIAEEPKVIEPVCEKPTESAPSPIKEDVPQVETSKIVEDSEPVESKEVRSDDVPPPLPSSNPPSPVTVFAESTKADALSAQEVPLLQSPPASLEILESASGSDVASIESKQEVTPVKVEAGDVKSELFVSESEKTENELKTVEQKTIDITSESSDAMMSSDNSCAKNLSETLNNVSSIETSETVVAPSEPLLKSEDTSSDAPISSEAVLESIQTPIEEIPVDIPTQSDTKIDVVSELAQEQPVDIVTSDISEKIETLSEPLKTPESTEVLTEETKILNVPPESSSNASEEILPLVVEAPIELQSLPDPPTEVPEALESTETLPEVPAEIESCPVREINSVSDTLEKVEAAIVEAPEELKKLTETNPVSSESLPVPPKLDEIPISIKTTGLDQEQTPSVENSPVATQSYVTLPVSPPPSPALVQDSSKPSLDGSLLEPAMPSPETEQFAINAADSLQDISTESLPSLPEPFSENFAEPMSLPPVDSVPEPIAVDSPTSEPPLVTECPAPVPSKNSEVLTNGNTNGLPSPVNEECSSAQPMMTEGPLKQVISNDASDVRQDVGDSTTDSSGAPAESAKVEE